MWLRACPEESRSVSSVRDLLLWAGRCRSQKRGVNGACAAHDACYDRAHIDADGNLNASIYWSQEQVAAAKACNQILYNAVRDSFEPGATSIQLWMLYGDRFPFFQILRPKTAARP